MQQPSTRTLTVARIISLVGHPFVLLPITIILARVGHLPPARLITVVAIFVTVVVVPILFVIRRRVAAGVWTDMDVSDHGQRGNLYTVSLIVIALSIPIFWWLGLPRGLIIGTVVSMFLLLLGMAINLRTKISMHAMFGAYCVIILAAVRPIAGLVAFVLIVAIGWSRVILGRHTLAQVVSGISLGIAAGLVLLWLLRH